MPLMLMMCSGLEGSLSRYASDPGNEGVHGPGLDVRIKAPDILQKLGTSNNTVLVKGQVLDEVCFMGGDA
ncbi:MAG: hypothetical protein MZV63_57725 [Marinilabiliales bacterium]|nr:hypothetical protein [Marinilabiliales bacterium]